MKKVFKNVIISAPLILFVGCATIQEPVIHQLPSNTPDISKTIELESQYSLKRKVSIGRFTNETNYGQGKLFNNNYQKIGTQAMDILSTKLTKTGKFLMFERPDIEKISNDINVNVAINEENKNPKRQNFNNLNINSDYIIIGSVSEFGRKNTSETGVFSRTKKQTANAKVNVRLVDVKTGEIIYAEEGRGESFSETGTVLGAGSHAGYDSSLNDKALDAAISKLVSNVVENLLNKPWRSYALEINDNEVIMSGGKSQNIRKDDIFIVKANGRVVKNPQTGLDIELPGEEMAKIKVFRQFGKTTNEEISFCQIIEGSLSNYTSQDIYIEEMEK